MQLYPRLLGYATSRIGDVEEARDAVSETMARTVASKAGMGRRVASFDSSVFMILHHVIADSLRQAERERRAVPVEQPHDDVANRSDLAEEHALARRAYARLRPHDRDLLDLLVVGCLSVEEVAHVLRKRPGAVRTAKSRALQRLRDAMKGMGDAR